MKREATRYAEALARLLDLLADEDVTAEALTDAARACRKAEAELAALKVEASSVRAARAELERCRRLHAMVVTRTGEQLAGTDKRLTAVRKAKRALPTPVQQEAGGLSCDMRA